MNINKHESKPDTPLTDAASLEAWQSGGGVAFSRPSDGVGYVVPADFARDLERKLAQREEHYTAQHDAMVRYRAEMEHQAQRAAAAEARVQELAEQLATLLHESNRMQSELAAAREDTARLDWLEESITKGNFNQETGRIEVSEFSAFTVAQDGIRAAIDAARKGTAP